MNTKKIIPQIETIEYYDDRFYKIKTKKGFEYYPSVTTVLGIIHKEWLARYYGDLGTERAQYRSKIAMEQGSEIHRLISELVAGNELSADTYPQEQWLQLCRFADFHKSIKPKYLLNEQTVLSHKHKCAGTLDLLIFISETKEYDVGTSKEIEIEAGVYVIDIKTGKNEDDNYNYQTAAYFEMVKEMKVLEVLATKRKLIGTGILYLNTNTKSGWKLKLRNLKEIKNDFKCFKSALFLYNLSPKIPKIIELPKNLKLN
jgi:hypothetical protein